MKHFILSVFAAVIVIAPMFWYMENVMGFNIYDQEIIKVIGFCIFIGVYSSIQQIINK